jgi:dihydropyrimidinase
MRSLLLIQLTTYFAGAKHVCAPPLRHSPADLDALWSQLSPPSPITVISSDHAPHTFAHPDGKQKALHQSSAKPPTFSSIPNGLPGLETRLPLLFDAATGPNAKISLPRYVELTSTNAAKLYGLDGVKGSIAPGYDADLTIWYPEDDSREIEINQEIMHHNVDYTPFEGMKVRNWPRWTVLRGTVVWDRDDGGVVGEMGMGRFLKRGKGKVLVGKMPGTGAGRGMKEGERELWVN